MFPFLFRKPSLEIHIPISPTPLFLNMAHYFVASLRRFGGHYKNADVIFTIGETEIIKNLEDLYPWLRQPGIEIRWLPRDKFIEDNYFATAVERFRYHYKSDVVLMLDADILISKSFDELIFNCHRKKQFVGLIAHVSPFSEPEFWQKIYDAAYLGKVSFKHEHTGWGKMFNNEATRFCPPYFNLGVLCAPSKIMNRIGQDIYDLMHAVNSVQETIYRCQLAVSLAITKHSIPYQCMAMRYNFPNVALLEEKFASELPHAAILHLLADHQQIFKNRLFDERVHIEEMLARNDLQGVNLLAQQVIRQVHPEVCQTQVNA